MPRDQFGRSVSMDTDSVVAGDAESAPGSHREHYSEPAAVAAAKGEEKAKIKPGRLSKFIAHRPFATMMLSLGLALVVGMATFALAPPRSSLGVFYAIDEKEVKRSFVVTELIDGAGFDGVIDERSIGEWYLYVYYRSKGSGSNIFSVENVEALYAVEQEIQSVDGYGDFCMLGDDGSCTAPLSPVSELFYPGGDKAFSTQEDIDAIIEANFDDYGFFFSKNYDPSDNTDRLTRATFAFGAPLAGYDNPNDRSGKQEDEFKPFIFQYTNAMKRIRKELDGDVFYIGDFVSDEEVLKFIDEDFALSAVVGIIVTVNLGLFLWSWVLAAAGMTHNVVSFVAGYFIYRVVFQIEVLPSIALLALYVILGLGADNVFIMADAWKQSNVEAEEISGNPALRLAWVLRRAGYALLVTNSTTFFAFIAASLNPIPGITSFGIMAASTILVNFFLVTTWFPAVLVVWDRRCASSCCLDRCVGTKSGKSKTVEVELGVAGEEDAGVELKEHHWRDHIDEYRAIERFFALKYSPFVLKFKYALVFVSTVLGLVALGLATQLAPPDRQPTGLPEESNLAKAIDISNNEFPPAAGAESLITDVYVVFGATGGIKRVDENGNDLDPNDEDDLGQPILDDGFSASPTDVQLYIASVCDELEARQCTGQCPDEPDENQLVLRDDNSVLCFMTAFRNWTDTVNGAGTFPVPEADFHDQFEQFLDTSPAIAESFADYVGYEEGSNRITWAIVRVYSSMGFDIPLDHLRKHFNFWEDFMEDPVPGTAIPPEVDRMFKATGIDSGSQFAWLATSDVTIESAFGGLAVSMALAFVLLNISTANYILATFAIVNIGFVVCCVLAAMVVSGYGASYNETISISMLAGLAVDFCSHVGVAYTANRIDDRGERVTRTMLEMGISLLGGALTTCASGFLLLFAQLEFFFRFGLYLFLTIAFSWIFTHFWFVPLLATAGPIGQQGSWRALYRRVTGKKE